MQSNSTAAHELLALKALRECYAKIDKAHVAAEGFSTSIISVLELVQPDSLKDLNII